MKLAANWVEWKAYCLVVSWVAWMVVWRAWMKAVSWGGMRVVALVRKMVEHLGKRWAGLKGEMTVVWKDGKWAVRLAHQWVVWTDETMVADWVHHLVGQTAVNLAE